MDNENIILPDDFVAEQTEAADNDFTEVVENGSQYYDSEETMEYNDLYNRATDLAVQNGYTQNDVDTVVGDLFEEYIQQRDIDDFIREGGKIEHITKEAIEYYHNGGKGKMTIQQCVDKTDPFVKGLGIKTKAQRRTSDYKDPFIKGFNSI